MICICSKDGLKISLKIATVLAVSSYIIEGDFALSILDILSSQRFTKTLSSASSSATRFPTALVLTITPKFLGFMLCRSCLSRARSSRDLIFCDTDTLSVSGIKMRNLPAKDISEVNLGPLVEIGSLAI